jgi:predicted O-methyltransferase YrrM
MKNPLNNLYAGFDPMQLYEKYDTELRSLSRKLRSVYHAMQKKGHGTTFGDVEGELMYLLIRETHPDIAFEVSPDCGWSTNYILAALTANKHGVLHSFELEPTKYGESTEKVIRSNQCPDWEQSQLVLHIGDARSTVQAVQGQIDFLLIDSCHEDWFARWYIDNLFPRVKGTVVLQDIAFVDGLEASGEARYAWEWLKREKVDGALVGMLEEKLRTNAIRASYAERRDLRSNSIVFILPSTYPGLPLQFAQSLEQLLGQAQGYATRGESIRADELVSKAAKLTLYNPQLVNRHRLLNKAAQIYMQIDEPEEATRMFQRSLGVVVQAEPQQRVKSLAELIELFIAERRWGYALQACFLLTFARRDGMRLVIGAVSNNLTRRFLRRRSILDWVISLVSRAGLRGLLSRALGRMRGRSNQPNRDMHDKRWHIINADYQACKDQIQQVAQGAPASDLNKTVLFICSSSSVQAFKLEGVLSLALRLKNYSPQIVELYANPWCQRYHNLFGNFHFVKFKEFLTRKPIEPAPEILAFKHSQPTVFDLMNLTYRQVDIGRVALSNVITRHKFTSFDLSQTKTLAEVTDELAKVRQNVIAAEALLDDIHPAMAFLPEKGLSPAAEIFGACIARGIPVVQYTNSQDMNGFVLKRFNFENRHHHPFSLDETTWEKVKKMNWNPALESELMNDLEKSYKSGSWFNRKYLHQGKQIKSADSVRQQLGLDPNKKTAVIFSHVLWDATFFYGESLFKDYETWLLETLRVAIANPNVNWVVKLHPDLVWKLKYEDYTGELRDLITMRDAVGAFPEHIKLVMPDTDVSTYSFFEFTDYCLTVRGTIGIEMACHGVPVITAGTGRYSNLGFTYDSAAPEEYLQRLAHIQDTAPMSHTEVELARRFAHALFKLRPWNVETFEILRMPIEQTGNPLDHNLALHVTDFADFATANDIRHFTDWIASDQVDYLSASF